MDASGVVVVDAVVYGSQQSSSSANGTIASPEIATLEAEQGKGGCIAVVPTVGRGGGPAPAAATAANRSLGRAPDGFDADSLCTDFIMQPATTLPAASAAGATNIKVASVADFAAGQAIMIDAGANLETAVIATVGTAGATGTGHHPRRRHWPGRMPPGRRSPAASPRPAPPTSTIGDVISLA